MNYPDCNLYMDLVTLNGFDVNWCYSCNRIWLNSKILDEILSKTDHLNSKFLDELIKLKGAINKRYCPNCKEERLYEYNIDRVLIDQCINCYGVFFEKGELNKLVPNIKREEKADLNYEHLPYSPIDYLDIDVDEKIEQKRTPIGPWQSVLVFLLFMIVLVLPYFID